MSKSLVLGNGVLTVGLDQFAQVKDCYFDYVGLENQMGETSVNRIGIWIDGAFSWFSDGSWQFDIDYKDDCLIGEIVAKNSGLQIEVTISDCVYNEKPIFIRHFTIKNLGSKRKVKLFLNHSFEMYRTPKGDTVYFDPNDHTIVHYKGRRIAVIAGLSDGSPFTDYSVGLSGIEGKAGTWMDAEDGVLSKNSIEHGNVDSTICFEKEVEGSENFSVVNWISFAKTLKEAKTLHEYALKRSPGRICETTEDFWKAWINKTETNFYDLPKEIISLYKKSLLILRVHVGEMGEVIASVDSDMLQWGRDNYNYVWPRDAAYVTCAFDCAGYPEVARKFFDFANVVISDEGYFFHKYRPDKSLGSSWHGWVGQDGNTQLPIQEDETASVLISLWHHYETTKDLEYIEKIYNSLIKKAANFLVGFRAQNKLPYPTFDLWEMKMGVHTYTVSLVFQALIIASKFAQVLGKEFEEEIYRNSAMDIKNSSMLLWNESSNYFKKSLNDLTLDTSSFYGAWKGEMFDKEIISKSYETLKSRLYSNEDTKGFVRFENDMYFRNNPNSLGNPWIITTLWESQYRISISKNINELERIKEVFEWVNEHALKSGVLSEQLDPISGFQLSASPLAWSHAELITTINMYLKKYSELKTASL